MVWDGGAASLPTPHPTAFRLAIDPDRGRLSDAFGDQRRREPVFRNGLTVQIELIIFCKMQRMFVSLE